MATIVPELDPELIENEGERRLYVAARALPDDFTVLYSFRYCNQVTGAVVWEADLIIVHPFKGFVVYQVKSGEIGFFNGRWHEFVGGSYRPLAADPVQQARSAAYAIVRDYKEKFGYFPLNFDIGLCFPDCTKVSGEVPAFARPANMLLRRDIENLPTRISEVFSTPSWSRRDAGAIARLVENVLTVNFRLHNNLEEQIKAFEFRSELKLTQEQQRILDETGLNKRMVFLGAAGTGKTMLAVEKARQLAAQGKRVLLTCFNRSLASQFPSHPNLTALHFHGLLEMVTGSKAPSGQGRDDYFEYKLPQAGLAHFASLPEGEKFDSLIVDEGQDFRPHWFTCLEAMVKEDGEFYVFADPSQNIFAVDLSGLEKLPVSKFRLTINLRNTAAICQRWIEPMAGVRVRLGLKDSGEIYFHPWATDSEQRRLVEREVERLVDRGIRPRRITILSPNRKERSCLAAVDRILDWPLVPVGDPRPDAIRFSTIRAFKGLEADVVLLIGIRPDSQVCSRADLYVGGSRARYALHVFHRRDWQYTG